MSTFRSGGGDAPRDARGGAGPAGAGRPGTGAPGAAGRGGRRPWGRRKVCVFCAEKVEPEYKSVNRLRRFLSDRARIESGKKTGTCSRHQRLVRREIKRARFLGLLPFTGDHLRITGTAATPGARPPAEAAELAEGEDQAVEPGDEVDGAGVPAGESESDARDVEPAEDDR